MARFFGGLSFGLVLFALAFLCFPQATLASSNSSYDAAMATCMSPAPSVGSGFFCNLDDTGLNGLDRGGYDASSAHNYYAGTHVRNMGFFPFSGTPPNLCLNAAPFFVDSTDGSKVCSGGCEFSPQGGNEKWWVRTGSGVTYHQSRVEYQATGNICAAGTIPAPPPTISAAPPICGGGSCYDPNTGNYCATDSSGAQFCVPQPAPGSGACASSGSSAICAGNGVPPPSPSNPPIGDPSTDIGASDQYGSQSGGGTINSTTVNNFAGGGTGTVNNGAQPGSAGAPASGSSAAGPSPGTGVNPASSSSAGGNKGTASGGGDCNTPPMCSGDAPTCAVLAQVWDARCKGDGVASNDADTSVPGLDGIGTTPGAGFIQSSTVLDKLDATGFGGGGQCPRMPAIKIPMFNVDYESDWPEWCTILGVAGNVIMLLAAFMSLRIVSEG